MKLSRTYIKYSPTKNVDTSFYMAVKALLNGNDYAIVDTDYFYKNLEFLENAYNFLCDFDKDFIFDTMLFAYEEGRKDIIINNVIAQDIIPALIESIKDIPAMENHITKYNKQKFSSLSLKFVKDLKIINGEKSLSYSGITNHKLNTNSIELFDVSSISVFIAAMERLAMLDLANNFNKDTIEYIINNTKKIIIPLLLKYDFISILNKVEDMIFKIENPQNYTPISKQRNNYIDNNINSIKAIPKIFDTIPENFANIFNSPDVAYIPTIYKDLSSYIESHNRLLNFKNTIQKPNSFSICGNYTPPVFLYYSLRYNSSSAIDDFYCILNDFLDTKNKSSKDFYFSMLNMHKSEPANLYNYIELTNNHQKLYFINEDQFSKDLSYKLNPSEIASIKEYYIPREIKLYYKAPSNINNAKETFTSYKITNNATVLDLIFNLRTTNPILKGSNKHVYRYQVKIDDKIVPLNTVLQDGDHIIIEQNNSNSILESVSETWFTYLNLPENRQYLKSLL